MSTSSSIQQYGPPDQSSVQNRGRASAIAKFGARIRDYALLTIVACVLRLSGLTHQSLWFDEGYTLTLVSARNLGDFLTRFAHLTTSEHLQPLYYILMFAWTRIAGTSDFALRLPSALTSIASCFLLYDIALHVAPTRHRFLALAIAMCCSFSSFSVFYAQDARPYALVQCLSFAVLASWIHRRYPSESSHTFKTNLIRVLSNSPFFAAIILLACLASVFNVLLIAALVFGDGLSAQSGRAWRRIWLVPLFVSTGVVGMYAYLANRIFPFFVRHDVISIKQPLWMNIAYTLYSIVFGTSLAPSDNLLRTASRTHMIFSSWALLLPGGLALALTLVATSYICRRQGSSSNLTATLIITVCTYAAGLFFGFGAFGRLNVLPRHASTLFALLSVLAVAVIARLGNLSFSDRLGVKLVSAAVAAIVLCNIASLYRYITDPNLRKDEYRETAYHIPDDGLTAYLVEGQPILLEHYGVTALSATEIQPAFLAAYLRRTSGNASIRLIINNYRNYLWDSQPTPTAMISSAYSCTQEQALSHMDVERCEPRPQASLRVAGYVQ